MDSLSIKKNIKSVKAQIEPQPKSRIKSQIEPPKKSRKLFVAELVFFLPTLFVWLSWFFWKIVGLSWMQAGVDAFNFFPNMVQVIILVFFPAMSFLLGIISYKKPQSKVFNIIVIVLSTIFILLILLSLLVAKF